jgi:hypothetical protein
MEDTIRIDRILQQIETFLRDVPMDEFNAVSLLNWHMHFAGKAKTIMFREEVEILSAIQYAVVYLCLTEGPVPVFTELRNWMVPERRALAALTALLFLQEDGIAGELEKRSAELPVNGDDSVDSFSDFNPIVVSLAARENSVRQMAGFISSIFVGFSNSFSVNTKCFFRNALLRHLKAWAKNSLPHNEARQSLQLLFATLLSSGPRELSRDLYEFLKNDADFSKDADLHRFQKGVFAAAVGK